MTVASRYFRRTLKLGPVTTNHLRVERDLRVPMPRRRGAAGRPVRPRRAPAPGAGPLAVRAARHLGADPGPAARRARLPGADRELPGDVRVWRRLRPVRDR